MKTNSSENNVGLDIVKWIVAIAFLAAGVVANQYYATLAISLRLIGWLVLVLVVAGIVYTTSQGQKLKIFVQQANNELRKVVWPTRQETVQTTAIVAVMVLLLGCILWGMDSLLLWAIGLIAA